MPAGKRDLTIRIWLSRSRTDIDRHRKNYLCRVKMAGRKGPGCGRRADVNPGNTYLTALLSLGEIGRLGMRLSDNGMSARVTWVSSFGSRPPSDLVLHYALADAQENLKSILVRRVKLSAIARFGSHRGKDFSMNRDSTFSWCFCAGCR